MGIRKLQKVLANKRRNNEELDRVLGAYTLFDSPQQVFDASKEKLLRYIFPSKFSFPFLNKSFAINAYI